MRIHVLDKLPLDPFKTELLIALFNQCASKEVVLEPNVEYTVNINQDSYTFTLTHHLIPRRSTCENHLGELRFDVREPRSHAESNNDSNAKIYQTPRVFKLHKDGSLEIKDRLKKNKPYLIKEMSFSKEHYEYHRANSETELKLYHRTSTPEKPQCKSPTLIKTGEEWTIFSVIPQLPGIDLKIYVERTHEDHHKEHPNYFPQECPLGWGKTYSIFLKIAENLHEFHMTRHEGDIYHAHCDIKPANILYCEKSHRVSLCDFGSSRPIGTLAINSYGTSADYAAPEYYSRGIIDEKSDGYSLGKSYLELLTLHIFQYRPFLNIINSFLLPIVDDMSRLKELLPLRLVKKSRNDFKNLVTQLISIEKSERIDLIDFITQTKQIFLGFLTDYGNAILNFIATLETFVGHTSGKQQETLLSLIEMLRIAHTHWLALNTGELHDRLLVLDDHHFTLMQDLKVIVQRYILKNEPLASSITTSKQAFFKPEVIASTIQTESDDNRLNASVN